MIFFFFSSRRRHTRSDRDWSSDVCSSDLPWLAMLLRSFKLPTMAARYAETLASAEEHHWGYRKFLLQLCEAEAADRQERKRERLLKQSGLPAGKTLATLDEGKLPLKIRRQLPTLLEGGFVERAENVIAFG